MSPGALPGFRDFYPTELAERSYIFQGWRDVARRYGFVEYDGPPLEPLELYTKKSGAEIVDQLYNFTDKGGREVALRPEMTPTLARMVAARANAMRKPVRWFSIPQLFRYERAQRGRLREHFQFNVDIIGEADVSADAELVALAIDAMREFGLTSEDVVARVSDRRLLNALLRGIGVTESQHPAAYAALDKLDRDPREVLEERLLAAGLSASTSAQLFALAGATADEAAFTQLVQAAGATEEWDTLRRYLDHTESLGVRDWVRLDLSIVRGLAYYTGIVFELFDAKGELRAICGGGRYDTLLESLGGVSLPALGFGMGDVVLGELLRSRGKMPQSEASVDVWVAYGESGGVEDAMSVAAKLRARGRSVEYALGNQKLARQLKAAHAAGAKQTVVVATPELGSGEAMVRRMDEKTERKVRLDAWLEET
ncbi:MAG TPA: histidine--tRNA ligase [Gemmatimonadaceae bacterium]|nr:histidine--tRNA ligase [Gemmatimonadaceae bacterium]